MKNVLMLHCILQPLFYVYTLKQAKKSSNKTRQELATAARRVVMQSDKDTCVLEL